MTAASRVPARLTISADADCLAEGRAFVRALAASVDADEETTSDIVQAVDELACNVIEHGYRHAPGKIELEGQADAEAIVVRLRDAAPPFDPRSVPEPRLDLPLAHRPFGGMGIHLARTLTDGIDHRILPGGGNEVTVTKRLRPAAEGAAREAQEGDHGHHDRATER